MLKKLLSIILVYLMTIPINYIPYINAGILHAKKYRVTVINIEANGNISFSKRMTQFIKDELETKNRIDFFKHNVQVEEKVEVKKEEGKKQRTFDKSKFEEIATIKNDIKQQVKDKEYSMIIESWQQIIDTYEENFDNLKTIKPLFEAYINKAHYEGLDEMDDEAKADIKTAVSIGRNLTFDNKKFSPRFLVEYKRERKRSKKKAKATITLKAPSTDELIIDGISLGNAPVKVTGLSYGKHFVVVLDSNKQVIKKKIFELTKRKKVGKIVIKKEKEKIKKQVKAKTTETKEKTDSQILSSIYLNLQKTEFNEDIKNNLEIFAKRMKADFIVFGNSIKKHDMYNAQIYLYNAETKTISFLTKGEFDTDLLTGDVEGLRIGNEIVKGIDNFSSLKPVIIKKKTVKKLKKRKKESLRIVAFSSYEKLNWEKPIVVASNNDIKKDKTSTKEIKKDNDDTIDLDSIDTVKEEKKDKKDINIADADYTKLDADLDKYSDENKDDNDGVWYTEWWIWTIIGVVVVGATAGTVYVLTQDTNSTQTSIPSGTWKLF